MLKGGNMTRGIDFRQKEVININNGTIAEKTYTIILSPYLVL